MTWPKSEPRSRRSVSAYWERNAEGSPQTEIGRSITKEMDVPASLMDRMVRQVGEGELKEFKPRGKPQ